MSNSQLMRTAAFLYFRLSSRKRPDNSPIRSRLSPRYSRSSIFFVITFVTSRSSSLTLSRFCDARLSWYSFFVRWINVSNSTKAYGRRLGDRYCEGEYDVVNSEEISARYVKASLRGYDWSHMQRKQTSSLTR